uniref:Secreted protein n=1 Tax=Anopheles darlingi TaxID=43151 RepID=A0A2M4D326_ANODA
MFRCRSLARLRLLCVLSAPWNVAARTWLSIWIAETEQSSKKGGGKGATLPFPLNPPIAQLDQFTGCSPLPSAKDCNALDEYTPFSLGIRRRSSASTIVCCSLAAWLPFCSFCCVVRIYLCR